jgi:hypothetical protein
VKDENGDLADTHNSLNRLKNYLLLLLNVYNVHDDKQLEIHTAETLVPGPSHLEVEIATAKFLHVMIKFWQVMKHYSLRSTVTESRSRLLYQFTRRVIKLTVIIIMGYHCYQLLTRF